MFDKRCAVCGDMVGPYGDGKWLHVANQYPDPPHEVVLTDHMQRCGAAQGGMFCICDSLRDERDAALDAAREAVAACKTHVRRRNTARDNVWSPGRINWYAVKFTTVDLDEALAAIDAVRGGSASDVFPLDDYIPRTRGTEDGDE